MKLALLLVLVASLAVACGSGKKQSNGFGAATQPPPAQTTVSTSQVSPVKKRYPYPRTIARKVQSACVGSGRSVTTCTCILDRLENTVPPQRLGTNVVARIRKLAGNCPKS